MESERPADFMYVYTYILCVTISHGPHGSLHKNMFQRMRVCVCTGGWVNKINWWVNMGVYLYSRGHIFCKVLLGGHNALLWAMPSTTTHPPGSLTECLV